MDSLYTVSWRVNTDKWIGRQFPLHTKPSQNEYLRFFWSPLIVFATESCVSASVLASWKYGTKCDGQTTPHWVELFEVTSSRSQGQSQLP